MRPVGPKVRRRARVKQEGSVKLQVKKAPCRGGASLPLRPMATRAPRLLLQRSAPCRALARAHLPLLVISEASTPDVGPLCTARRGGCVAACTVLLGPHSSFLLLGKGGDSAAALLCVFLVAFKASSLSGAFKCGE